jgi:MYXO-CTERM domain-containing protein
MLRSWFRRLGVIGCVLFLLACSGGGCSSGCAGCGVTPLPGGFPKASAITNAGSIRVTRAGLDFAQANLGLIAGKVLGGGTITYPIGPTSFSLVVTTVDVCKSPGPGQCQVEIDLTNANLTLTAVHPHSLTITGTIPVEAKDITLSTCSMHAGLGANASCNGGTPTFSGFAQVPVTIVLPLVAETIAPRDGYTKVDATNATVSMNISTSMINVCASGLCSILSTIIDALKSSLIGYLTSPLQTQIKNALQSALCTKTDTTLNPSCPTGSHDNGGTCYYDSAPTTCVPTLLGMDGHVDLSGFLASLSPGTAGGLDFVLASGGDGIASSAFANGTLTNTPDSSNGLTLALMGGGLPNPQSGCVPTFDNKIPTGIPIPDEMQDNTITPWPQNDNGPDLGIALAGRYLNYMMGGVYNSGALCLGISTDQFSQLQSGLLSVLIPSIKKLTFEQKPGPVAITTRPQQPPVITIGGGTDLNTDPLLSISLKQFAIDFYIWSMDRYVRAMTFTGDMTIPVNLTTHVDPNTNPNGGLLPAIGSVKVDNPTVTNSQLLTDNPATIASGLGSLFGAIAGQLTGAMKPINLSSSLASYGLGMTIPDGGIRKLTKDSDDFLAIFADLALAQQNAVQQADVQARILDKTVDATAMTLSTADRSKEPKLQVQFSSSLDDGTRAVEYSYAIDKGARSEWLQTRNYTIQNDALFLQGKHTLNVWARIKGQPMSESAQPAQVPFTIDVLPPNVTLSKNDDGSIKVDAWDIVSPDSALQMRWQTTDSLGKKSEWTSWSAINQIPASSQTVTVQVKDEEGNIGSESTDLIRGKPDPSLVTGSGCGSCAVGASGSTTNWAYAIPALAGLLALMLRRRRHEVAATRPLPAPAQARRGVPSRTVRKSAVVVGVVALGAAATPNCNCGGGPTTYPGCGSDCQQVCDDPLAQGLIGAYTSLAVAKDGTTWVSGYNDSDGSAILYGDLVVGKWDPAKGAVQWQSIDGVPKVPDGQCPAADQTGWRTGIEEPGDDVGLWTSMVLDSSDHPMVAYYDATNHQLKFAHYDGSNWNISVVSQKAGADQGRYVKMILVSGKPVVAFLDMEAGNGGYTRSRVIVGRATTDNPSQSSDWTFEDAAVDEADPCQPQFCTAAQACLTTTGGVTGICTPTVNGCSPACAAGQACISQNSAATCVAVYDSSNFFPSYPTALGDYVSLANGPNGLGLAVYDRFHGNLWAISNSGGKWTSTLLDGQTGSGSSAADTGDDGIAANLVISPNGDWNITYVNGIQEYLQYILWPGGKGTPLAPEIVDDGYDNGKPYPDGQHVVGDDAMMQIDGSGNVTIAYQDSTAGTLRVATGAPAQSGTHKWTTKAVAQQGRFAGFFPRFVPGTAQIANWWRTSDATQSTEAGDVTLVTP